MEFVSPTSSPTSSSSSSSSFSKFITLPNEFSHPSFSAPYKRRYNGRLCKRENHVYVKQNDNTYTVCESFVVHHWAVVEIAKIDNDSHNHNHSTIISSHSTTHVTTPFQAHVTYVIDQNFIAQVLMYEIWINSESLRQHMYHHGTFPFEIALTKMLKKMLSICGNFSSVPRSIKKIDDQEYQFLHDSCPAIPCWNHNIPLFRHQLDSLCWMIQLEKDITNRTAIIQYNTTCTPIASTGYFYHRDWDLIAKNKNDDTQSTVVVSGGILADVTGSGKTAITLALILTSLENTSSTQPHDQIMTSMDHQIHFRSSATLIIIPSHLCQQWLQEWNKFTIVPANTYSTKTRRTRNYKSSDDTKKNNLPKLKIIFIRNMHDFKRTTLGQLMEADIVFSNKSFLLSKNYTEQVSRHIVSLVGSEKNSNSDNYYYEEEGEFSNSSLAWRIAISRARPGFIPDQCIPLESIYWKRVVIDEIHEFLQDKRNPTGRSPFCGCFNWGLTGTPMTQNPALMEKYARFILRDSPKYWMPDFIHSLLNRCFHRFDDLDLPPIDKNLHLIEHTEQERQLLQCCQDEQNVEKMVQLCSYFNLVEINDMNQKIQLLTIEEITKTVKKDRQAKIKEVESKIKYHDMAVKLVQTQIAASTQEMKQLDNNNQIAQITVSTQEKNSVYDLHQFHHLRDLKDTLRTRQKRLERMTQRLLQLRQEKINLEKSMSYFELVIERCKDNNNSDINNNNNNVSNNNIRHCPICLQQKANVVTQCGHLFCRTCIISCLKKKYECPICKHHITPKDAHEIKLGDRQLSLMNEKENISRYGTKLNLLLNLVKAIIDKQEKVAIYIQWATLMRPIREMLRENDIQVAVVHGNTACQNAAIRDFRDHIHVLLGNVGNAGLNLIDANHFIFVHALVGDEYIVKTREEQALARVRRQGQNKQVYAHWLIMRNTVEEQLYLQTR